jgi:glycosyltransferase involved in cell wall biosynthesis
VVDTGSTDRTREIAREFGARVFDFVWVNDFAAARNAALARATGNYAFWLDADDVLDPPERVRLQALLDSLRPGMRPRMWSAARAIRGRTAMAGRRWWTISEAEACWRRILTLKRPDQFCSVDQGIYGHLTLRNLAVLAEERGDGAEARRLWSMVLDACRGDAEAEARGEAAQ